MAAIETRRRTIDLPVAVDNILSAELEKHLSDPEVKRQISDRTYKGPQSLKALLESIITKRVIGKNIDEAKQLIASMSGAKVGTQVSRAVRRSAKKRR
jgi:hypothetical protein